jgi:pilus assembly protein Flp/PilA
LAIAPIESGTPVAIRQTATREAPRTQQKRGTAAITHRTAGGAKPEGGLMQLVNFVKSFARNEEGQDLLEYALLVALIALVAIAAVTAAGSSVSTIFNSIAGKLNAAAASS